MRLAERDIERTICDFLTAEGWTVRKMEQNFSERKRKVVGEPGQADRLAIRYQRPSLRVNVRVVCEVLWIEMKAPKGKPTPKQLEWHSLERARGAQTIIMGVDCPASITGFLQWYSDAGLRRRVAA